MAVYNVSKARSKVTGTSQDDLISNNYYSQATILGGGGDDIIFNNGSSSYISGGIGDDYIKNTGEYTIIDAGAGNDTIISDDSEWSSIYAGKGNDVVSLKGIGSYFDRNVTVGYLNGDGSDKIFGMDSNDVFSIGSGSWSSVRSGSNVVLTIGSGKVTLVGAYGKGVKIAASAANKKVSVKSSNSNVTTGAGKDTIQNSGYSKVKISTGAGNDSVYNYKGNSATIDAGTGNDTILNGTWNVGSQIVYYYETGGINVSINAGDGDDKIFNVGSNAKIYGGAGKDTIYNYESRNAYVDAGAGDDFIINGGTKSTILAGAGNDIVHNYGSGLTISGGDGNDYIYERGYSNVSINAGTGNDLISLTTSSKNTTISYRNGEGNDRIYGMDSNDVFNITSGTWSSVKSGSNVILTVGSNKVTLFGAANKSVKIVAPVTNQKVTVKSSNSNVTTGAGNDVIYNPGYSKVKISTGAGNDSIVNDRYIGNSYRYGDSVTIDAGAGNDTIVSKDWNYHVSIKGGKGNDVVSLVSTSKYTTLNYADGDGNDTVYGFDSDDFLNITGGTWSSVKSGNDTVINLGNGKISLVGYTPAVTNQKISVKSSNSTVTTGAGKDTIQNSGYSKVKISTGAGNDSVYNYKGNSATIDAGSGNDTILNGQWDLSKLSYYYNTGGNSVSINAGTGDDKIFNVGSNAKIYAGTGNDTVYNYASSNVYINAGDGSDYINANGTKSTILGGAGNDNINNFGSSVTISGGAGNDYIYNTASNVSINAGTGNDRISLTSNAKNTVINYKTGEGNTTVYGFNADDKLQITGSWSSVKSGNNTVVNVGTGRISLVGYAPAVSNQKVTVKSSNSNVTTGAGNDVIYNPGYERVKITSGAGNDSIFNDLYYTGSNYRYGDSVTIDAGAGNDTIVSRDWNYRVSINGGAGNDVVSLFSTSKYTTLSYAQGDGNDKVYGLNFDDVIRIASGSWSSQKSGNDVILNVGTGKISLVGVGSNAIQVAVGNAKATTINAAPANQKISVTGSNQNVVTGAGNDTIQNSGYSNVKISTGAGNDSVYNYKGNSATIDAGAGNDTILNGSWNVNKPSYYPNTGGDSVSINAGDGDDKIYHVGSYAKIYGGAGKDTIFNYVSTNVSIDAGDDDDLIFTSGTKANVNGGAGRDTIYNYDNSTTIDGGAGDDRIENYAGGLYSSLNGGAGHDYIYNYKGNSATIDAGAGNDTILNGQWTLSPQLTHPYGTGGDSVSINAGDGDDKIYHVGSYAKIYGGAGKDTIFNYVSTNVSIDAGDDDDLIFTSGTKANVNGGAGRDTIYNYDNFTTIDGGAGDDRIENYAGGLYSSLNGGAGNDYIVNYGDSVTIDGGLGNDTLVGHGTDNSLSGVDIFQYSGGNDVITNYSGEDKIQIANGKVTGYSFNKGDLVLKIGNSGTITLKNMTNHYITVSDSTGTSTKLYSNGTTPQNVIKTILNSLQKNISETNCTVALDKAIQATKTTVFTGIQSALNKFKSDFTSSGGGDKFLRDYCGIILDNADTGAITGWDAGGRYIKTAESIVPEYGSVKTVPKSSFTKSGLTIQLPSSFTQNQQNITNGLYTWWIDSSLNLIKESYGLGYDSASTLASKSLNLKFFNNSQGYVAQVDSPLSYNYSRIRFSTELAVNEYYYPSVDNNPNPTSPINKFYLDRTIAHEMTHAVQMATFGNLPTFFTEGLAELTVGIDDKRFGDILYISLKNNSTLKTETDKALTNFGKIEASGYSTGYMFWRYLGKQIADNYSSSSSSKAATTVKTSKQVISDSDYNSSLWGGTSSNSTLRSAMTSIDDHLTVQDNLSSIDLGLNVDDISRQFSNNEGLIIADNSNSSLNMLDTSNITFGVDVKKNLI